jgi:GTP-binding protein
MKIKTAEFIKSSTDYLKCPEHSSTEYAFIGRSNVGKSSLINMLCNQKKLAKSSSTPGKTQVINHFLINQEWYLVDLPGYGYARISKSERVKWELFIRDYIEKRQELVCLFVLLDSRHKPQQIDLEFVNWTAKVGVPICLVFTKADKSKEIEVLKNVQEFRNALAAHWEELPPIFITSAENRLGRDELIDYIDAINKSINQQPK